LIPFSNKPAFTFSETRLYLKMSSINIVIKQLRSLASQAENRVTLVKDQSCINMIKLSLEAKDEECLSAALETLFFLTGIESCS
jgi:hypothetical protein